MIVFILIVMAAAMAYYTLLSKYGELWSAMEDASTDVPPTLTKATVSILVPFRNERDNLSKLLHNLDALNKDGYSVQVVMVNDHSTDGGEQLVKEYAGKLDIVLVNQTENTGKKAAIRLGWEHCKGDYVLQTDADCVLPFNWLGSMLGAFSDERIDLACGPVQFHSAANFWKQIVALDFEALIAIGAAHIQWGKPMICNAANLAYRKSLIVDLDLNDSTASGDDVFLLQSAYSKDEASIVFVKNKAALVKTDGPNSFSAFWHQRLRWASKNGDYDIKQNMWILAGVWSYNVLILLSLLSFTGIGVLSGAFLILIKVLAEDRFYSRFVSFFDRDLWFTNLLFGQPFHILYMAIVPPLSQVLKYKWKERKLR